MPRLVPIHYKVFEQFLKAVGCYFIRSEGDHHIWKKEGLKRPIVVRTKKDLPVFEIKNNLRTLGISNEDYLKMISTL